MLIKSILISIIFPFIFNGLNEISGTDILKKMHDRYHGKWYQNFTFDQDTKMYINDSLKKTEVWHEAIKFPDKFRIDMGAIDSGNAIIFKGDSVYQFHHFNLRSVKFTENDLLFLLGGMYYNSFEKVMEKMKNFGYDLSKGHTDFWKGKPVFVIGAGKGELNTNQLWVDQEKLFIVRMINFHNKDKEESLFEDHVPIEHGFTETTCIFYINGKLIQYENYHNCKTDLMLNEQIFEPSVFGKYYWFKN